MLFNSIEFAIFLPLVFAVYWFVAPKSVFLQNLVILISSYFFYAWWDWKFLGLIIFSSSLDFYIGRTLSKTDKLSQRKLLLYISIVCNIALLGIFKYYNFFAENFSTAFRFFGYSIDPDRLNLILPLGISFYTFQTLSYTIDVYNKKIRPTNDILSFFCFVSFFPQLVAGPIERASSLLFQFTDKKTFNYQKAVDGSRQMLWGFFKKIVIADNCAYYVNIIFSESDQFSGSTLALGAILFAFQIYGDFSGYSDIAIGIAKLFGFEFKQNFAFPYFAKNSVEFWRRWHISLTSWFRDYVYIPLGGSKGGYKKTVRNVFVVFIISGFWHGANWTFIIWAIIHFLFYLTTIRYIKSRNATLEGNIIDKYPKLKKALNILFTFAVVTFAWIFFRAENVQHAFNYVSEMVTASFFSIPSFLFEERLQFVLFFVGFQMLIEWKGKFNNHALELFLIQEPKYFRYGFYYGLIMIIFLFGSQQQEFIYFQF